MSQVDNRNSSATKRARTDGGRREDDWTCPSCANVNFSFRTTCNMRNCSQSRPAHHNAKSAFQTQQSFSSPTRYIGTGAPSPVYLAPPPYVSSVFNGTSIPAYDVPFSRGSPYPYNYGTRLSAVSPYPPLHLSAPAPYNGPMMRNGNSMPLTGGMYGPPPLMDRYGLGMPIAPAPMGPRPVYFLEDDSQKKDGARENDWKCPKCGNLNFSFRTVCNMRNCDTPKPGAQGPKSRKNSDMPEGSWKCEKCNNINYHFRTKCNRQNCGADKPSELKESPSKQTGESDQ